MLVPRYAFTMRDPAEEWLLFKGVTTSSAYCFEDDKFSFPTFEGNQTFSFASSHKPGWHLEIDARIMQSVLTGQYVELRYVKHCTGICVCISSKPIHSYYSCRVEKVDYKTRHNRFREATQKFPVSFNSHKLNGIEKACVIQLWTETDYTDQVLDVNLTFHLLPL